jgi:hypothetical protein
LPGGRNTENSPDGLELQAKIKGHLRWSGDKIDVIDLFVVFGDVDFKKGNVDYHGDVEVYGNVLQGFTVKGGGDVTVFGNVDGGTVISENGDVTVKGNATGTSEGMASITAGLAITIDRGRFARLNSQGTITAQNSLEHSEVHAGGDLILEAGPAMSCELDVEGEVRVSEVRADAGAARTADRQRKHVRVAMTPPVPVVSQRDTGQKFPAEIMDLSAGGMRLQAVLQLRTGEDLKLQFKLPGIPATMWMEAKMVREIKAANAQNNKHQYAMEFTEIEANIRETLAKFCVQEDARQRRMVREVTPSVEHRRAG